MKFLCRVIRCKLKDEDSEEAARACRVQAQHERKPLGRRAGKVCASAWSSARRSLVRWDHAGGVKEHRSAGLACDSLISTT